MWFLIHSQILYIDVPSIIKFICLWWRTYLTPKDLQSSLSLIYGRVWLLQKTNRSLHMIELVIRNTFYNLQSSNLVSPKLVTIYPTDIIDQTHTSTPTNYTCFIFQPKTNFTFRFTLPVPSQFSFPFTLYVLFSWRRIYVTWYFTKDRVLRSSHIINLSSVQLSLQNFHFITVYLSSGSLLLRTTKYTEDES